LKLEQILKIVVRGGLGGSDVRVGSVTRWLSVQD
jgi:hypothetical protein